jgi:hypothetical protein
LVKLTEKREHTQTRTHTNTHTHIYIYKYYQYCYTVTTTPFICIHMGKKGSKRRSHNATASPASSSSSSSSATHVEAASQPQGKSARESLATDSAVPNMKPLALSQLVYWIPLITGLLMGLGCGYFVVSIYPHKVRALLLAGAVVLPVVMIYAWFTTRTTLMIDVNLSRAKRKVQFDALVQTVAQRWVTIGLSIGYITICTYTVGADGINAYVSAFVDTDQMATIAQYGVFLILLIGFITRGYWRGQAAALKKHDKI